MSQFFSVLPLSDRLWGGNSTGWLIGQLTVAKGTSQLFQKYGGPLCLPWAGIARVVIPFGTIEYVMALYPIQCSNQYIPAPQVSGLTSRLDITWRPGCSASAVTPSGLAGPVRQ